MDTRTTEVADGIHQITTFVPEANLSFNQYLITGEEPTLFHTGPRQMLPIVQHEVARIIPLESLRWIGFGHVESDECGSMNDWLIMAPRSEVVHGKTACMVSLRDLADRPPVALADGDGFDAGGHFLHWFDTPHLPHNWEAGVLYDATTRTLFCGDLFEQMGRCDALTSGDIVGPAAAAEDVFGAFSLAPSSGARIRKLAELEVATLALMHGPAFTGDCRGALLELADDVDTRIAKASAGG